MELTIYQQTSTNGVIKLYCQDCKPQGTSQRSTLMVGGYGHYCDGCGGDFKEMAEYALSIAAFFAAVGEIAAFARDRQQSQTAGGQS